MRIFFSMRHQGALRNFSSTIRALAERGHQIHLSFVVPNRYGDDRLLHELLNDHPSITHAGLTKKRPYRLSLNLARRLRMWLDYLRFLEPEYATAHALRARAEERIPRLMVRVSKLTTGNQRMRRVLRGFLMLLERALPTDRWITGIVRQQTPDLVLVTPLVDIGSDQTEFVKSAGTLGVPTGLCVHSWDNLTNKGLIRVVPDRVFVWNDIQKREAVEMHGVPPDAVVVTGAPVFDQWFDRGPSTTREEFCRKTRLPADRPFLLYVGSSAFIAPQEAGFVAMWLRAIRSAPDTRVRNAAVLVRPHPENVRDWDRLDLSDFPDVVVWPREGANPVDAASKNDFFDSIHHCAAVVGINTTALIEAGIQQRPVFSVRSDDHAVTQEGTLHFQYLLTQGGGLLHHAQSLDEHVSQLARALAGAGDDERSRTFIQTFVRPFGLDQPATPRLADGIEALGTLRRARQHLPVYLYPLRLAIYFMAFAYELARLVAGGRDSRGRRPMTVRGALQKPFIALLDGILAWRPARGFVKRVVVPRVISGNTPQTPADELVAVHKNLEQLFRGGRPIIIGPWLSELGFEVLYWIPFLQWVKTYWPFEAERLIVVSRGGVHAWYANLGGRYFDLFDLFTPEEFRRRNEQRVITGRQKQHDIADFDLEIARMVRAAIQRPDAELLHPRLMYRLFNPYWNRQTLADFVQNHTSFERLPAPEAPMLDGELPETYVAVRFYFNDCFPETDANRRFIRHLLTQLTRTSDVVMLNSGLQLDDHVDWVPADTRRIHTVDRFMTPQNNLQVQSAVISRATGFIGTYGGLAYLPPFYGVNSIAFFSGTPHVAVQHLEFAQRVCSRLKRGSFTALDVGSVDLLARAFGDTEADTAAADAVARAADARVAVTPLKPVSRA
jgi:hypothetical protein